MIYEHPEFGGPHYITKLLAGERRDFVDLLKNPDVTYEELLERVNNHKDGDFVEMSFKKAIDKTPIDPHYRLFLKMVGIPRDVRDSAIDSLMHYGRENPSATYTMLNRTLYETFKREMAEHDRPISQESRAEFNAVLQTLRPREAKVLDYRNALSGGEPMTLRQVASEFNLNTGERIRQIEAKALRKLRHPSKSRRIRPFFGQLSNELGSI